MIEFIAVEKKHVKSIINLSDTVFGAGFLVENEIFNFISYSNKIGIVAIKDNNFIGYILTEIYNSKQFIAEIISQKELFKKSITNYNSIGMIKQVAVNSAYRNKGVANQLIKEALIKTNQLSELVFCLAWKKGEVVALKNILINNSFKHQLTINNYWKQDSSHKKYDCVYCGSPPCKCTMEVYIKKPDSLMNQAF